MFPRVSRFEEARKPLNQGRVIGRQESLRKEKQGLFNFTPVSGPAGRHRNNGALEIEGGGQWWEKRREEGGRKREEKQRMGGEAIREEGSREQKGGET